MPPSRDEPARFDQLTVFCLLIGAYAVAISLTEFGQGGARLVAAAALLCTGLVQLWMPHRFWPTALIAGMILLSYVSRLPVASNNQLLSCCVAIAVLLAAALTWPHDRAATFRRIAMPGRWLLAVLYFYGIFHKINVDFLDPQVSCAVELYRRLAWPLGLQDLAFGQYGAIYATFVAEGIAMAALFSRRWKKLGFLIGLPFHVAIGLSGYAYYIDFCVVVFACYALFLPTEFVDRANAAIARAPRLLTAGRVLRALLLVAILVAVVDWQDGGLRAARPQPLMPVFLALGVGFTAAVWFWLPWRPATGDLPPLAFRPAWLALLPVGYFVLGASPYVGLRTEASIAMYSNLHTEGGVSNHLLLPTPPYLFDYQRDVVRLRRVGDRELADGPLLVRYEVDRIRSLVPGAPVAVEQDGVEQTIPPDAPNSYAQSSWLLRKFLLFKPVDYARPKVCTH